jgi:hypothetical protein
VTEILNVVDRLAATYVWTPADAERWWQAYDNEQPAAGTPAAPPAL